MSSVTMLPPWKRTNEKTARIRVMKELPSIGASSCHELDEPLASTDKQK